ncbi:MAG: phosphatase PAP2 family protein [Ginsengibacter sp.]|jgi:membrane-associated phospholipid phosphatase
MALKSFYKQNLFFFIGYLLLAIIAGFVLIFLSKADGFFLMNPWHSDFLDMVFIPFTYFGDGFFIITFGAVLFFLKRRMLSLMILSSYLISGIIAQILKYFIVEARPAFYLEKTNYPHFIDGVTLHNFHSFPSGHTASAFALAAVLSFAIRNKNYSVLFLLWAALVGYSRMYLGQHFMDDVFAGSLIGILSSVFCWIYFQNGFRKILIKKFPKDYTDQDILIK